MGKRDRERERKIVASKMTQGHVLYLYPYLYPSISLPGIHLISLHISPFYSKYEGKSAWTKSGRFSTNVFYQANRCEISIDGLPWQEGTPVWVTPIDEVGTQVGAVIGQYSGKELESLPDVGWLQGLRLFTLNKKRSYGLSPNNKVPLPNFRSAGQGATNLLSPGPNTTRPTYTVDEKYRQRGWFAPREEYESKIVFDGPADRKLDFGPVITSSGPPLQHWDPDLLAMQVRCV